MSRPDKLLYILSTVAVLVVVYLYNPLPLFFQNDDFIHIPQSERGIWLQNGSFRPVSELFIRLDVMIWEKSAWGYHLTNLLLHMIAAGLVYFFAKELFTKILCVKQYRQLSLITAILFFSYALHSEAVFWILGRSSMLATIFSLLFLFGYLKTTDSNFYFILCIVSYVLALLSYESSWLLLIFAGMITIRRSTGLKSSGREAVFLFVLLLSFLAYLSIRMYFTGSILGDYLATGLSIDKAGFLVRNLFLLIVRSFIPPLFSGTFILSGFALIFILFAFVFIAIPRRAKENLIFLSVLFLISVLPFIGLGVDSYGTESERFLYLPTVFASCILTYLISKANFKQALKLAAFVSLVLLHLLALNNASNNYRKAGEVVQQTLSEIEKLDDGTQLHVKNLPQNQKGAYIFRSGFTEMCNWYGKKISVDIISYKNELSQLKLPLKVEKATSGSLSEKTFFYSDAELLIY